MRIMRIYGDVLEENEQWVKQMTCALYGHHWKEGDAFWSIKQECTFCGMREVYLD